MSEYQYYEFRAIDRPLTDQQMRELRVISTRAAISRTSFSNHCQNQDRDANRRCGQTPRSATHPTKVRHHLGRVLKSLLNPCGRSVSSVLQGS